jgi:predicted transposase YdaD
MWFDPARVKPLPGTIADKWLQQGWREGILEGIELVLDIKFGSDGLRLWPEIRQIEDAKRLRAVQRALKTARTPEELRRVYQ